MAHDILIVQKSGDLPGGLRETLQQRGFTTRTVVELSDALTAIKELVNPILVLDCGTEENTGFDLVKSAIDKAELHKFPMVVIGKDVDGYEGVLGRYFKIATTINTPCSSADIVEAVLYISKLYEHSKEQVEPTKVEPPTLIVAPDAKKVTAAASKLQHQLFTQFEQIPELIFDQLHRLNIFQQNLGGASYSVHFEPAILEQPLYKISDKTVADAVESIYRDSSKWGRMHLQRTRVVCAHLCNALPLDEKTKLQVMSAAGLYAWTFADRDHNLLRQDYSSTRAVVARKDLCSKIKDSAMKVAVELNQPEIGNIIATAGRQIGHEESPGDDPQSLAASAIVAADLTDRICFANQTWSPRAAYGFLKRVKSGKIKDMHPAVLSCLIKFLSEAISSSTVTHLVPKGAAHDKKLHQAAEKIRNQEINSDEKKVAIAALLPGMRLSRPIYAFDGKQVLSENLLLDQDLIWRIWQLAALRPLNGPAVVRSEEDVMQ